MRQTALAGGSQEGVDAFDALFRLGQGTPGLLVGGGELDLAAVVGGQQEEPHRARIEGLRDLRDQGGVSQRLAHLLARHRHPGVVHPQLTIYFACSFILSLLFLGAMLTSVILLVGSTLVIVENIPKLFAPEKVNYDGMLVLGIVAIVVNTAASRVVSHGHSHNESILSLHFLEDILGWIAVIVVSLILRFTDWYFLDPLLSLFIAGFILSQALPKFWENIQIFLDHVPSDVDLSQLYQEIAALENVRAITQLNVWTTDGLEKFAMLHICLENPNLLAETQDTLRRKLHAYGIAKVTIQTDESLQEHQECCVGRE